MTNYEVLERALLTFAEYALVTIVAANTDLINVALWKAAALAGAAGTFSYILNYIRSKKSAG